MQAGEGGGASNTSGDMFNMRGFSANNSLFVDGVRDDGLIARDVFNLEQIEVFSGPTGSDVGRTNAAGYINLDDQDAEPRGRAARDAQLRRRRAVRATVDINQPMHFGDGATFLGQRRRPRQRAVAGRRRRRPRLHRAREPGDRAVDRVRPQHADARQPRGADHAAGQPRRLRPARRGAHRSVRSTPTAVVAATPVDQDNYYGSPDYDYDKVSRTTSRCALEHDLSPGLTLRNQTRYNTTTREAVITSIANAAAYNPATNLVTLSRQANTRTERDLLEPDQPERPPDDRRAASRDERRAGDREREPVRADAGRRRHARPGRLQPPRRLQPGRRHEHRADRRDAPRASTDTVAFYAFDAFDLGPRFRVNGGVRVESYNTKSHAVAAAGMRHRYRRRRHARQRQGGARSSGSTSRATSTSRTARR